MNTLISSFLRDEQSSTARGCASGVGFLCSWTCFLQKGIFNPFHIWHKYFFQADPLNKFTITNQKGKYDTSLMGVGEEMRGK